MTTTVRFARFITPSVLAFEDSVVAKQRSAALRRRASVFPSARAGGGGLSRSPTVSSSEARVRFNSTRFGAGCLIVVIAVSVFCATEVEPAAAQQYRMYDARFLKVEVPLELNVTRPERAHSISAEGRTVFFVEPRNPPNIVLAIAADIDIVSSRLAPDFTKKPQLEVSGIAKYQNYIHQDMMPFRSVKEDVCQTTLRRWKAVRITNDGRDIHNDPFHSETIGLRV